LQQQVDNIALVRALRLREMCPKIHLGECALLSVLGGDRVPTFLDRLLVSDMHESRVRDFLGEQLLHRLFVLVPLIYCSS